MRSPKGPASGWNAADFLRTVDHRKCSLRESRGRPDSPQPSDALNLGPAAEEAEFVCEIAARRITLEMDCLKHTGTRTYWIGRKIQARMGRVISILIGERFRWVAIGNSRMSPDRNLCLERHVESDYHRNARHE